MKIIVTFLAIFALSAAVELPPSLKTCRRKDPQYQQCLSAAVPLFIKSLSAGLRNFRILPIEPLAVDSIKIGESTGPVSVKQSYRNIKLYGLTRGLEVNNYRIDFNKLILTSDSYNPQVDFVADYELDGQVLVLPIHGKGHSNITMIGLHAKNTIYCDTHVKDGETYLRIKKYDIKFHPERVLMHFGNLFDGDNALAEQMNTFIAQNSDLLFKELQASYEETFGLVFAKLGNEVFSRIPMNKLFPQ
ncbi:protein takeout [Neodiprion lecontei]|uniref:Protein takeout n=1 Tax=Neodiprion lecontei TaxID=441921 RepID=A0A6J0BZJ1_NEOLC|nr:protein takeout [Neodiprion lecontei]